MPSTPDRPDDSDDPFAVAEAAHVAARETVPVDRVPAGRPTEGIGVDRPTEAMTLRRPTPDEPPAAGDADGTEAPEHQTVLVDDRVLAGRETVKLPTQRRPAERVRRAPLPVAAGFA